MSRAEKRKRQRDLRKRICFGAVALVSLAAVLYSGCNLLGYYADHREEKALEKELSKLRDEVDATSIETKVGAGVEGVDVTETMRKKTVEQLRSFYNKMKQKNADYVCWITLKEAGVDYPVLKKDNSFYLNHDMNGEKNRHGSIFMDENCDEQGDVLLIHGHHMKDGTMFGGLKKYKEKAFCEENREVILEFEEECANYCIFAVAQVDLTAEGSFSFEQLPGTAEEKVSYIEELDRASFWYDEAVVGENAESSSFVVLSTCDYGTDDERLLVVAKKIE